MAQSVLKNSHDRFVKLVRSIWMLTSDFPFSDQEAEERASYWVELFGGDFFDKYGKYVSYLVKQSCRDRSFRGAIHADEFYRMFCRVCLNGQVYSFRKQEWISESEAVESILNSNQTLGDLYRSVVDVTVPDGRCVDSRLRDSVLDQCRAIIYGWED